MMKTSRFRSGPLRVVDGAAHAKRPLARTEAPACVRWLAKTEDEKRAAVRQEIAAWRDARPGQRSLF